MFARNCPDSSVHLVTSRNGVDLSYYNPEFPCPNPFHPARRAIVMTGRMDYRPNYEGAKWFIERVLPGLLERHPDIHFYIVGAKPQCLLREISTGAVSVVGEVADIRPYLKHAAVCAPLQLARGVQNKVLEAMAMRKPVVATTVASRGLTVTSGVELFVADSPADFTKCVLQVFDADHAGDVAIRAHAFVKEKFDWASNLSPLVPTWNKSSNQYNGFEREQPLQGRV